ncbi:hypothetical protein [Serratia liquefaciens]|uniref:hypothetical protein n=1 Tax=Serratia liquefaciens TaxID=614 RepID=UPI0022B9846D|nr:hypothetical protein [Serratia liquefaciens]
MSNEKLSELSKPVAWTDREELAFVNDMACMWTEGMGINEEPLYSQEYVSALLASIDGMSQTINVANDATRIWKERALAAEAKLATPVRLPSKNDDEFWFDGVFQVAKFDRAVERAISATGFKFVGDE